MDTKYTTQVELASSEAYRQEPPTEIEQVIRQVGAELAPSEAHQQEPLTEIEWVIEQIGARYITDLRLLNEAFGRFYEAQLAAKDEQIAELHQRLEAAEQECEAREIQIRELKRTSGRYIADLRAVSEELRRRVELAEAEEDNPEEVGRGSP